MANYSPYKMKGHTLPGIKQRKSPAKKELVGGQHNLPTELKAKIEAAPTKMYGKKSPAKDYGHEPEKPEGHTHSKEDPSAMTGVIGGKNEDKVINESGDWVRRSSRKDLEQKQDKKKSPAKIAPLVAAIAPALIQGMMKKKEK
tara:strand:+ start:103 stop:531 length:429 start_codon:yes stop_codon:yes gene_type:complete